MAGRAVQVLRYFHVLDPDPVGDWVCCRESQEAEGIEDLHRRLWRVGGIRCMPRGLGVYLLLIH